MKTYDVVVVGAGGAGLSAAIEAKNKRKDVLVISKSYPTHSQTVQAQGGINAVIYDEKDSVENHIDETYKSSQGLAKRQSIRQICQNAKETILWLDRIGVPFSKTEDGKFSQRPFGGTKYERTCYSSDYTGLKILHTLYDNCIKEGIDFLNEQVLLDFNVKDNELVDIVVLDLKTTNIYNLRANSFILATGGAANCYAGFTTNSVTNSADGLAIALNNGLALSNMEFIQFHPTTLRRNSSLISESARAEGALLVTNDGKRFVNELDTRDKVARAIKQNLLNNKDVYLDFRHLDKDKLNEIIPQEIKLIEDILDLDITTDLIPVKPSAHYSMGGIKSNVSCETSLKNLFVVGEIAQAEIHGANRLGGNSLLEIISLGRSAGRNASKIEKSKTNTSFSKKDIYENIVDKLISNENIVNISKIKKELGNEMFNKVGLYRDKNGLEKALKYIQKKEELLKNIGIKDKSKLYNKNLLEYFELKNMLLVSKAITLSAIKREESRGSHYRIDYNKKDEKYEKNSIIKKVDDELKHYFEKV